MRNGRLPIDILCRQNVGDVFGRHEHARKRGLRGSAPARVDPSVDRLRVLVRPTEPDAEERQAHAVDRRHGPARRRSEHYQQQGDQLLQRHQPHVPGRTADNENLFVHVTPTSETIRRTHTQPK